MLVTSATFPKCYKLSDATGTYLGQYIGKETHEQTGNPFWRFSKKSIYIATTQIDETACILGGGRRRRAKSRRAKRHSRRRG